MEFFESIKKWTSNFFQFDQRRTNFTNEIRGGFVTFLTMSYIMLVNPQVVSYWMGGDNESLFPEQRTTMVNDLASGTAVVCSIGSIALGLAANLPFAIGPGMSMNSVFAGTIALATNQTQLAASQHQWNVAVTSAFFGGIVVFVIAAIGISTKIIKFLPDVLKAAIRVGIGLFQCFLALRVLRIIESEPTELLKFVDHFNFKDKGEDGAVAQVLFAVGLFTTSAFYTLGVQAPILISIVFVTAVCWISGFGGVAFPHVPIQAPQMEQTFWNFDWQGYFHEPSAIGVSLTYVVITLFDVGGAMFAVLTIIHEADEAKRRDEDLLAARSGSAADDNDFSADPHANDAVSSRKRNEIDDNDIVDPPDGLETDGLVSRNETHNATEMKMVSEAVSRRVYCIVGLTSVLSAVLGCSPAVVFLECLAGVASGARTGFSSIVTGLFFLLSLPFGPIFRNVPTCAAVPALMLIGCFMMSSVGEIPWYDQKKAFPAFVTIVMMPFTASITPGIIMGVVTYFLLHKVDDVGQWYKKTYGKRREGTTRRQSDILVA